MEARKDKLRSLLEKDSPFFREVQEDCKIQVEQKSRCVKPITRKGLPIVFKGIKLKFDPDTFIDSRKNTVLTNLTRDFFKTKKGECPGCGDLCKRFERAHTIKERPAIAKEALENVMAKHRDDGMFEESEFNCEFIDLHEKYPIAFICSKCHLVLDNVLRKEQSRGPLSYEDLKKIDYTGAKPVELLTFDIYGNDVTEPPKSMSQLRHLIFQGVATEHLRTRFSSLKQKPGDLKGVRKFEFVSWYDNEEFDNEGTVLEFFIRGSNNNEIMKDVLRAIFEETFEHLEPYRTTLFQFDLRLKLRLANGEIIEINNKDVGHFKYKF
jgi:hypothetical protein